MRHPYPPRVRVTVTADELTPLVQEGGGQAHESAIKEAETDSMGRALMTLGNPFGLALYDKQQEPDPGLAPLDPGTIQQILATVRGLPRPALEGFTKAFRKRFRCRLRLLLSLIGFASCGTMTGSRLFLCRTDRCAWQISTDRCVQPSTTSRWQPE